MNDTMMQTLQQIVASAGKLLLAQTVTVSSHKTANDLLTENDLITERYLVEQIRAHFPQANIISEETYAQARLQGFSMVIDPIDGTCNYAVGSDRFGIQIAVFEDEQCIAALLHFPTSEETIWATLGGGAWYNGQPITTNPTISSQDGMLLLSDYYPNISIPMDRQFALVQQLQGDFLKTRHLGAACVDFASLVKGQALAYICYYHHIWDIAPGLLIVREAGCCCSFLDGSAYRYGIPGLVVANNQENLNTILDRYAAIADPAGHR